VSAANCLDIDDCPVLSATTLVARRDTWFSNEAIATTTWGDISNWDTIAVTTMDSVFLSQATFNEDIGHWNTGAVTDMQQLFCHADAFNQNLDSWNTAKVTTMNCTFSYANAFNDAIGSWNTAKVTTMNSMFNHATAFNQNIGGWDVSALSSTADMFYQSVAFSAWCPHVTAVRKWGSTDAQIAIDSSCPGWTIVNGSDCEVLPATPRCIQSVNYGTAYPRSAQCTFQSQIAGDAFVVNELGDKCGSDCWDSANDVPKACQACWDTEPYSYMSDCYDFVLHNGVKYCSVASSKYLSDTVKSPPVSFALTIGDLLKWESDGSTQGKGWRLCFLH
tara:strand:- start:65 stop:1063 length:999 start_codon:yes stop_codon:yes gene_type:complete